MFSGTSLDLYVNLATGQVEPTNFHYQGIHFQSFLRISYKTCLNNSDIILDDRTPSKDAL